MPVALFAPPPSIAVKIISFKVIASRLLFTTCSCSSCTFVLPGIWVEFEGDKGPSEMATAGWVGVNVGVLVKVEVGVGVKVKVDVFVGVLVGVKVEVKVFVGVKLGVNVGVKLGVKVGVGVGVNVGVKVEVKVGVGVGFATVKVAPVTGAPDTFNVLPEVCPVPCTSVPFATSAV